MKRLMWLYTLLILVGCTEEAYLESTSSMTDEEIYAVIENENTDSRTYIDEQIRMRWTAEDCITLFRKTTYNRKYMFTGKTGANAGGFKQVSTDDDFWYGADVSYNYAAYPYSADMELDESGYFKLTMPTEQTYAENSFGLGANTMVAVSESGQLTFKNVCSYLRVRLYGENTSISSITLTSKGDEAIAGAANVTPVMGGNPTCEMTGTGKSIKLVCPNPVTISSDANSPTDFWIVVPPVTLSKGFTITVENNTGDTQSYEVAKSFTFGRNVYYNLAREVKIEKEDIIETDNTPYVTFTADAPQSFAMSQAVSTLEYSLNGGEWKELGTNTVIFGEDNGNLKLRGKNNYGTNGSTISFGNATPVSCSGDIRTLIDYENYLTINNSGNFKSLFSGCSYLLSAPELPATILTSRCYQYMFKDCTSLTTAPKLPATTLATDCYHGMFKGCTNLTSSPELPATVLEPQCYDSMFKGCTNLTTTPELPATTLALYCYNYMFSDCTNLKEASKLPAVTLADFCYTNMFYGCTSLKIAPELPATSISPSCYSGMFSGCTNLITPPKLPATSLAIECYGSMFKGCTNLTTSPELPATILVEECYLNMFQGCINLNSAPQLPATTLSKRCYESMFDGCTSLTSAPELHATTLATDCYYGMFAKCTSLSSAPKLPATILAENCYANMFNSCINLASAPELPATTLAENCYGIMFRNCINLKRAPKLPATTLAKSCYSGMFDGCINLIEASELPAITLAENCYIDMFYGCGNLTSAPELPAVTLTSGCYKRMFKGCANLIKAPKLTATTLATSCYEHIFYGCEKLNNITMLATNIVASKCLEKWVKNVSTTGTFIKSVSIKDIPSGDSGIPAGWTVVDYTE